MENIYKYWATTIPCLILAVSGCSSLRSCSEQEFSLRHQCWLWDAKEDPVPVDPLTKHSDFIMKEPNLFLFWISVRT
ncbi:hypothetical protein LINGRAHAP2_LOCUS36720 [Linum grandiflorum]